MVLCFMYCKYVLAQAQWLNTYIFGSMRNGVQVCVIECLRQVVPKKYISWRSFYKECHPFIHNFEPFVKHPGNGTNTHSPSACKVMKGQVETEF